MLMVMEVYSVSCHTNIWFQVQILSTQSPPINNHPTYHCSVSKFGVPSYTAPAAKKTLGFPTEDNIGKLLLRRMASDH
jgi:hypothetical protein